jgi:uncharacterized protein
VIDLLLALLLIGVLLTCCLLTLVGLPGNWLMIVAAAGYSFFVPADSSVAIGWRTLVALVVLAVLGEIVELLAASTGAARAGGGRRSAVMALAGSVAGGVLGLFVGIPIPIVGSMLAALLFAGLGAMVGAILGEVWRGKSLELSWRVGTAAFRGRLLGTLGKLFVGVAMVVVVLLALIL